MLCYSISLKISGYVSTFRVIRVKSGWGRHKAEETELI